MVFGARVVSTALESVDESRIVRHSRGYIPEFEIHHKKPRPPKVTSLPLLEKQQQKIKVGPPAPRSIRHVSTATASQKSGMNTFFVPPQTKKNGKILVSYDTGNVGGIHFKKMRIIALQNLRNPKKYRSARSWIAEVPLKLCDFVPAIPNKRPVIHETHK